MITLTIFNNIILEKSAGGKSEVDVDLYRYYEWTLCECEYGFYVDPVVTPQMPHCTPFPTRVNVTGLDGSFTDGTMGGRVRTGMDTKWYVTSGDPSSPRILAVNLEFKQLSLGNDSTVFVYAGDSRLDKRVARLSVETPETEINVTVLNKVKFI